MQKHAEKNLFLLALTAMFAALVTLTTAYLFHIPIGLNGGYIHLGDAFIYLAASFLPWPYAMAAAAIGASLADLLTGAAVYALPTLIIKALMVLPFTCKGVKVLGRRNIAAIFISGLLCTGGYILVDGFFFGTWAVTFAAIWPGLIQSGGGGLLYFLLGVVLDTADMKQKLGRHVQG